MYKKTFNLDEICIFRYKKTLAYKKQDNKTYDENLHKKRLELLKEELQRGI